MAKRNIFEMLGLEFDPPDNVKKIRVAYEAWKKRLTTEQNTTVDPARLKEIREELQEDNLIAVTIENPRFRQQAAEKLKQQRIDELRLYIDLQRGDTQGTLQVNQTQIRQIRDKLRLSQATIEATYKEQGFEIKPAKTSQTIVTLLNNFFLADSVMEELRKNFAAFQLVPDEKNFPWSAKVHDLYELAFYIEQIEKSPDFYRRRSTDDLQEIFREAAKKVSAPIPQWQSIKAILNLAQTQVFNTDDNRWKYDHSLKIETLADFFSKIKAAPELFKRDSYFADNCINRIRRAFPNLLSYELSVALYNKIAGLLKNPYEATSDAGEVSFCVTCANCGAFESFRTREESLKAHCKICGENFFIECPKCGKKIPTNAKHCPACEFSFAEMKNFNRYVDEINSMLSELEGTPFTEEVFNRIIAQITERLAEAKYLKPEADELAKIVERMKKITDDIELKNFDKYVDEMNSMLNELEGASFTDETVNLIFAHITERLAKAQALKPESHEVAKIDWRIKRIASDMKRRELYSWAEKKLPSISIAPAKAVSDCIEILRKIKDYKPAIERLKLIPPKNPPTIVATLRENYSPASNSSIGKISVKAKSTSIGGGSESNLVCNISWQAPSDLGVKYTLIKKADGVPQTHRDGKILIENTDRLEFADTDVKPGVLYGYAVFSTRLETFSALTTTTAVHYSDLDEKKLIAKNEDGACKFIWRLPSENCLGIRILRSDSAGKSVVVADCVQSPFVDNSVRNRKQYQYRLQCVYYGAEDAATNNQKYFSRQSTDEIFNGVWNIERTYKYSHGLTVTLTPEKHPKLVEDLICSVKSGCASFKWKSTGDFSIWFKEVVKESAQVDKKLFELDKIDELLGNGVVYKKAESSDEACEFALNSDNVKIAIISATHELGVVNEIVTCANVEPCEIDAEKTQIDAGGLKLVLKSVPENLYLIHYKINTDDADELYATLETAKARQMNRIYATKYTQDTFILQPHLPPKEIFITVIGEYKFSDGTSAYSAPSTLTLNNRPKEVISYRLEWGTSGFFTKEIHAKDCKLIIESNAKTMPKMFLVCRRDGRMNIELNDSATKVLRSVREQPEGWGGRLEIKLSDEMWKDISVGTVVKLLTSNEDEKRFDLKASRPDSLTVPKK